MPVTVAKAIDVAATVACYRYFAGWADKLQGKTIPIFYWSNKTHESI